MAIGVRSDPYFEHEGRYIPIYRSSDTYYFTYDNVRFTVYDVDKDRPYYKTSTGIKRYIELLHYGDKTTAKLWAKL